MKRNILIFPTHLHKLSYLGACMTREPAKEEEETAKRKKYWKVGRDRRKIWMRGSHGSHHQRLKNQNEFVKPNLALSILIY